MKLYSVEFTKSTRDVYGFIVPVGTIGGVEHKKDSYSGKDFTHIETTDKIFVFAFDSYIKMLEDGIHILSSDSTSSSPRYSGSAGSSSLIQEFEVITD